MTVQKINVLEYAHNQKPKDLFREIPDAFDPVKQNSIETGYFVFTMMPSLRCSLNCPHCYLSTWERRHSPIMSTEQIELTCKKVDEYYQSKPSIKQKVIVFYWYGGEPTEMGMPYMLDAFNRIQNIFTEEKGYYIRHEILTSLINVDESWFDVFKTWGRGHFQTSFDGLMRGKGYVRKWEKKVKAAIDYGLKVSTISVVNNTFYNDGPREILDYLSNLGIHEASFLPFMLNEQNKGMKYEKFAPPMNGYSDFMIELMEHWYKKKENGLHVPEVGQSNYIVSRLENSASANIAGQTMFLYPDGKFVLPDYKDGYLEFMKSFGNIFENSFEEILKSKSRRDYIRRQYTRNYNSECQSCEHVNSCIMEFWKDNREGDDCFGASRFVKYIKDTELSNPVIKNNKTLMF